MSYEDRLRQKLAKEKKRRDKAPPPNLDFSVSLTISPAKQDAFTQQYPLVLLQIEMCVNRMWQDHEEMDDLHAADAISATIRKQPQSDPMISELMNRLNTVFQAMFPTQEGWEPWVTGLRCIYTSIKNRSNCRRGDRDYLQYATQFLKKAGKL
ncbi:MAG TPA: hypothetical protein PKD54_11220 [Pirellulaceae bacterium]|nr:hypothetical protein [Pirellulaceae bacterium]